MNWWKKHNLSRLVAAEYLGLKYLGSGLNGVVFRARRRSNNQSVAIKFVHVTRNDKMTRRRLQAEVKAMESLAGDSCVRIYSSNLRSNPPYYVMEYLPLGDLRKALKIPRGSAALLTIFLKVCQCVKVCHERGITHRDIKPENVLFRRTKEPVLSDFGICKIGNISLGTTTLEMKNRGTPLYMAPEQLRKALTQSKPADIFALGTMLHFDFSIKLKNPNLQGNTLQLSNQCRAVRDTDRYEIEGLIDEVKKVIIEAREYRQKRQRICRIVELVQALTARMKKQKPNLVRMESEYLRDRITELNSLVQSEDRYQTSDKWHYEPIETYSSPYHGPKVKLSSAEEKKTVLAEASFFVKHMRKLLKDYR